MKKKLFLTLTIVALLCAAVIFTACGEKNDAKYGEYKNIAFATVGIENQNVQYSNVTEENGSFTVKIVIDGITYDVTIGADKTVKSVKINDHNVSKDELPEAPFENETTYIGKEAAKNIAFADAGVTANQVTSLKVEFDFDDGKYLYEVEFKSGLSKYEYDIEATTGEIHKKEVNDNTVIEKAPDGVNFIGIEEAKRIVLENANVTLDEVTIKKAKLDFEKGAYVYEIEFKKGTDSYEYEINAVTGAVINVEVEKDDDDDDIPVGQYISAEEAKRIATAHAGVTDAVFEKAELEVEHGVVIYEVEFTSGGYEYEYEINATTGKIIKQEKELAD